MDTQTILYLMAAVLMLVGLAGTVLPALPGIPLVFVGMVLAAWAGDFQYVGWGWLLALGILTLLSLGIDLLAGSMGAKRVGASKWAVGGALLGTLAGLFFGTLGLFAGPFVGALVGELAHRRDLGQAAKVGVGTWFGILLGTVLKVGLAFGMLGLFAFAWWV